MLSEVEFLRALVALSKQPTLESMADAALAAVMDRAGARHGYLELDENGDLRDRPWFRRSRHCSPEHVAFIQERVSKGILLEARLDRRTVVTPSAADDSRFKDLESVRQFEIGAVLCVPFEGFWGVGVVYLQGADAGGFSADARSSAELAASMIKLLLDAHPSYLAVYEPVDAEMDARKRMLVADALKETDWNISAVARKLKVSARYVRSLMNRGRKA